MSIRIKIFRILDAFHRLRKRVLSFLDTIGVLAALSGLFVLLYQIGFEHSISQIESIHKVYNLILFIVLLSNLAGIGLKTWKTKAMKLHEQSGLTAFVIIFCLLINGRVNGRSDFRCVQVGKF